MTRKERERAAECAEVGVHYGQQRARRSSLISHRASAHWGGSSEANGGSTTGPSCITPGGMRPSVVWGSWNHT